MRLLTAILSLLSLAAIALSDATDGFNVLSIPETQKTYAVGTTLPITWAPSSSSPKISLTLVGGATSSSLAPIQKIASGIDASSGLYAWLIPSSVGTLASYGINLTSDSNTTLFQYSNAFHISGGSTTSSTSSSSTTSSSSSPSTSSTQTGNGSSNHTMSGTTMTGDIGGMTMTTTSPTGAGTGAKTSSKSASSTTSAAPSQTSKASGAEGRKVESVVGLLGLVAAVLL